MARPLMVLVEVPFAAKALRRRTRSRSGFQGESLTRGLFAKRQERGVPALVLGSKRGQRVSKETLTNLFTSQQAPAASPRQSVQSQLPSKLGTCFQLTPNIPEQGGVLPATCLQDHCSSLAPFPVPPHLALTSILQVASGWKN